MSFCSRGGMERRSITRQSYHLEVPHLAAIDGQADESAVLMPPLQTCRTRVYVQQTIRLIIHYLQDMGMSGYEKLRRFFSDLLENSTIITPRITADVLHKHLNVLAFESQYLWKHTQEIPSVSISLYRTHNAPFGIVCRAEWCGKAINDLRRADVARMPYLIALVKVRQVAFVPIRVGVTDYAYSFHSQ